MSSRAQPLARVIGIGASAGGIGPLTELLGQLPAELPHALCVTVHVPADAPSALAGILDRRSAVTVCAARHGMRVAAGTVFVAPPDRHLVVADGWVELTRGPKENGVRPAADTMLRSIAAYGERAVAVVLSGALSDGSNGAQLVLQAGGQVFIQDPADATVSSMPQRALALVDGGAKVLSAADLGRALAALDGHDGEEQPDVEAPAESTPQGRPEGPATGYTCPECHGAMWELRDGDVVRYRCRVGHSYSEDAMLAEQGSAVEAALWSALEVLEERAELLRRMAARRAASKSLRRRFRDAAADADERARLIRRALSGDSGSDAFAVETGDPG